MDCNWKKYEELINQAFYAYPPDHTVEQFNRRNDLAFRMCYSEALGEAGVVPVHEAEQLAMFKFAKIIWEAGRAFECAPIPID